MNGSRSNVLALHGVVAAAMFCGAGGTTRAQVPERAAPPAHEHPAKTSGYRRPQLAVDAAFGPDGRLWVVGLDEHARLTLQLSDDEGRTWSAARTLDTGTDRVAAAGENRPRLVFGPQGRVVVVYAFEYPPPAPKPHAGEVRALRSDDGGRTFAAPVTLHQDRQVIAHSFPSTMFDAKGALHTFWIDKRDAEAALADDAGKPGDARKRGRYAGAAVYRNVSVDGGRTFGGDTKLADHACECCRIALAPDGDAGVGALWRHVFDGNVRDHAFARVGQGTASAMVRASFDGWKIEGCPHHGPGLAAAQGGGYHAVWFGERNGRAAVRYGRLGANGAPQGALRQLPDEAAEHADVQSAGTSVVVAWRSFDGDTTALRAWTSTDGGDTFVLRDLDRARGDNDNPKLVLKGDRIFVVWRTASAIKVHAVTP